MQIQELYGPKTGVYEEWDCLHNTENASKTVNREKAYQIQPYPSDGFPCKVTLAKIGDRTNYFVEPRYCQK